MLLPRLAVTLLMGLSFLVGAQTPASANGSTGTIGSSCATKYGRLFCWGYNKDSQLGLGDTANRSRPTRVGGAELEDGRRGVVINVWHSCRQAVLLGCEHFRPGRCR